VFGWGETDQQEMTGLQVELRGSNEENGGKGNGWGPRKKGYERKESVPSALNAVYVRKTKRTKAKRNESRETWGCRIDTGEGSKLKEKK